MRRCPECAARPAHARAQSAPGRPHRGSDCGIRFGRCARDRVLQDRADPDRVRLALPAQPRFAGDLVSVRGTDGEGRSAAEGLIRDFFVARRAGIQQARVAGLSSGAGTRERSARCRGRAGRSSVTGRERDRSRGGRTRAARIGRVSVRIRGSQCGAASDSRRRRGCPPRDAAADAAGRVLPAHRGARQRTIDARRGRPESARGPGTGRVDAGAVHNRSDRARGARGRRLGLRRMGRAPDARARSTLCRLALRARPGGAARRRHDDNARGVRAGEAVLEECGRGPCGVEADSVKFRSSYGGQMRRAAILVAIVMACAPMRAAAQQSNKVDLTGKWAFTVQTDAGTGTPTVTLKQDGEKLTGHYSSATLGEADLTGTVKGKAIEFSFSTDAVGTPLTVKYTGTVESKDELKGAVDLGGLAQGTFTAKRQ